MMLIRDLPTAVAMPLRSNFYFSARGSYAACLSQTPDGRFGIEVRALGLAGSTWRRLHTARPVPTRCQLLPCDDGRVLLVRYGADSHELSLLTPDADGIAAERLVGHVEARSLRLAPAPDDDTLGYALAVAASGDTTIHRIDAQRPELVPVGTIPGLVGGLGWLDQYGQRLGLNHVHGGRARPAVLELTRPPALRPLPVDGDGSTHVLLTSPRGASVLYARTEPGRLRLGWGRWNRTAPIHFPARLNDLDGVVLPLAWSPEGDEIALAVHRGTRSELLTYRLESDEVRQVPLPVAGRIGGIGSWSDSGLRFPYSAPTLPPDIVEVTMPGGRFRSGLSEPERLRWADARTEHFAGPTGPIEAIVYGDWRTSEHLLLALHGGPESAWELVFEPLFQHLSAAGIAIVAPNQRGSTGYGVAHRAAIRGAWGGPDLADVLHLAEQLRTARPATSDGLLLYGASYGAYLALLAAAHQPQWWRRCVAVAPFLSGARLYADATAPVRRLIERLDGQAGDGRNDVARLVNRLRMPLLLLHGSADEVIPVGQSRELHDLLHGAGHPGVTYRELPGAGHDPFFGPSATTALTQIADFLLGDPESTVSESGAAAVQVQSRR